MAIRELSIPDLCEELDQLLSSTEESVWNQLPSSIWSDIFVRAGNAKTMAALRMATATLHDLSTTSSVTDDYWRLRSVEDSKNAPPPWMIEINRRLPRFRINWKQMFDWDIFHSSHGPENNCDVVGVRLSFFIPATAKPPETVDARCAQYNKSSTLFLFWTTELDEEKKMATVTVAERVPYPTWFLDYVQPRITVRPSYFDTCDRTQALLDKKIDGDVTIELHGSEIPSNDAENAVKASQYLSTTRTNRDSASFERYGAGLRWIKFRWTAPYREVAGRYSVAYTVFIPKECPEALRGLLEE